jgi:transglutaminase-like putative cysteine protease
MPGWPQRSKPITAFTDSLSVRLKIHHKTHYRFDKPMPYGLQRLRLIPKENASQKILSWTTDIHGGRVEADYTDYQNNHILLVSIDEGAREISVTCDGEVETTDNHGIIGRHGGHVPLWYFLRSTKLTRTSAELVALARSVDSASDPLSRMHALSAKIRGAVAYETGFTNAETTADMALAGGHGVCQDHAHIFIAAARTLGIPARYVSGYLMMNDRIEQEASHAWAEAHIDDLGWVGFDISNGISPDPRYVRIATGADYAEAAPVSGVSYGGGDQTMKVNLAVEQ